MNQPPSSRRVFAPLLLGGREAIPLEPKRAAHEKHPVHSLPNSASRCRPRACHGRDPTTVSAPPPLPSDAAPGGAFGD
jgi:hypothetical protein